MVPLLGAGHINDDLKADNPDHERWLSLHMKVLELEACGFTWMIPPDGRERDLAGPARPEERPSYRSQNYLPRVQAPRGITLRHAVVAAIWHVLKRPPASRTATREKVASYTPEAFPELQDIRAKDSDGRDTPLRNELKNADYRLGKTSAGTSHS